MNSLTARLRFFLITLFVVMGLGTWGFTVLEHLAPADAF